LGKQGAQLQGFGAPTAQVLRNALTDLAGAALGPLSRLDQAIDGRARERGYTGQVSLGDLEISQDMLHGHA